MRTGTSFKPSNGHEPITPCGRSGPLLVRRRLWPKPSAASKVGLSPAKARPAVTLQLFEPEASAGIDRVGGREIPVISWKVKYRLTGNPDPAGLHFWRLGTTGRPTAEIPGCLTMALTGL